MGEKIQTIAMIGAGFMGIQIASRAAVHGFSVRMFDVNTDILKATADGVKNYNDMHFQTNEGDPEKAMALVTYHEDLADALKGADLAIEAIPEELDLKKKVFAELDKLAGPDTILATNSSSIPISKIEGAVTRKDKVMNIHFYIPIPRIYAVDLMRGSETSDDTFNKVDQWVRDINCMPLIVKKECMGFVLNRLWRSIKKDALKIWAGGHADIECVDRGWMIFTGMPLGPFGAMDYVGLDVVYDIEMSYYKDSGDKDDKPPQALKDMVDRGELGVKTGRGFYDWSNPPFFSPDFLDPKKK